MEEVDDLESAPATTARGADLGEALTFVTFLALLVGLILAQLIMKNYLGTGLFAK
jgi:hypothetical protein